MKNVILKMHPALILAFCGAVSAIVIFLTLENVEDVVPFAPGLIFGATVAAYLSICGVTRGRAAIVWLSFVASWSAAFYCGVWIYDNSYAIVGMVSGALGALIVAGGFAIALPRFRDWRHILAIAVLGLVAGGIALPTSVDNELLLFLIWQPVIGVALGWRRGVFDVA